jgi:hypothetical protein
VNFRRSNNIAARCASRATRPNATACTLVVILVASGCGYQQGAATTRSSSSSSASDGYHWSSVYRPGIKTVAVPIFSSVSYQRGVEFELSKAIVNQLEAHTPYKVVPRERADTILEGEITEVRVNTISEDRNSAIPQEQILDITVNFTWKDLRTGRILVSRRGWEQTATYYPTLGEQRTTGTQQAAERMALAIVQELQADW